MVARAIDDIIEYTRENEKPGILASLDYSKAFDSISKEFMLEVFRLFGFGPHFLQWLEVLNQKTVSCISYSGWLSRWFDLECGIRQGCPISPMCFVIACEVLSCKIRQSSDIKGIQVPSMLGMSEVKIMQFADDATLLVREEASLSESLRVIEGFSVLSGLKLNRQKTEALWLGCWKFRRKETAGIRWKIFPDNNLKILGIHFTSTKNIDSIENNWKPKLEKCELIIKNWKNRNLTLMGKITLIKSLLSSQFAYVMQITFLPDSVLKHLNTLFFKFLWSTSNTGVETRVTERVKRSTMVLDLDEGGLNMINMCAIQKTLAFKWISRLETVGRAAWGKIPKFYYDKLGLGISVFQSNVMFKELRGVGTSFFPTFYKRLLAEWLNIKDRNPEHDITNSAQMFWNNDGIRYKNNVLFCQRWVDHGLVLVSDIVSSTGFIMSDVLIEHLGDTAITQFEMNIVNNASGYNSEPHTICTNKDFTVYLMQKPLHNLSSKTVRTFLAKQSSNELQTCWSRKYGAIALSKEVWLLAKTVCSETRLICLQWKILHNIYGTNVILNKMGKADSANCLTCKELDTLEHFFFHCKTTKDIWAEVEMQIHTLINKRVKLAEQDVMLGLLDRDLLSNEDEYRQVNLLIIIAKLCISKFKYGKHPNITLLFANDVRLRSHATVHR